MAQSSDLEAGVGSGAGPLPPAGLLLEWFGFQHGWISPHVQLIHDQSRGFHLRATKSLESPTVVTCPASVTLSWFNLDHTQNAVRHVESLLQRCISKIPRHILSVLVLVEQKSLGDASFWHPYIASLPRPEHLTTPLYFTDEDLRWLEGTNLEKATQERRQVWQDEWKSAREVLRDVGIDDTLYTWESCLWAATIFSSRAFTSSNIFPNTGESPFALLFPVIDILNHAPTAKVEWNFDPEKSFTLKLLGEVHEGDELFNNYAPKQNDELLLGYGFALSNHPFEQVPFKLQVSPSLKADIQSPYIPFNLPADTYTSTLSAPSPITTHYLRPGLTHPLGRYPNLIPSLRGIPPLLVLISYHLVLQKRSLPASSIPLPNPGGRLLLATIRQISLPIRAMLQKLLTTGSQGDSNPLNTKQKFAKIYREGQVAALQCILAELKAPESEIMRLTSRAPTSPSPCIISTAEALALLNTSDRSTYEDFVSGTSAVLGIDTSTPSFVRNNDIEDVLWMLWFSVTLFLTTTTTININPENSKENNRDHTSSLISSSLSSLRNYYPFPVPGPSSSEAEELNELQSYLTSLISALGPSFPDSIWSRLTDSRQTQEIIKWAAKVVITEAFPHQTSHGEVSYLMFFEGTTSSREGLDVETDNAWMFV